MNITCDVCGGPMPSRTTNNAKCCSKECTAEKARERSRSNRRDHRKPTMSVYYEKPVQVVLPDVAERIGLSLTEWNQYAPMYLEMGASVTIRGKHLDAIQEPMEGLT